MDAKFEGSDFVGPLTMRAPLPSRLMDGPMLLESLMSSMRLRQIKVIWSCFFHRHELQFAFSPRKVPIISDSNWRDIVESSDSDWVWFVDRLEQTQSTYS